MDNRTKIALVAGGLVVAFAAGRYSTTVTTKTETKVDKVEEKKKDVKKEKHKKTTTVTVEKPDGSKETTSTTTEDTNTDAKTITDAHSVSDSKTETTRGDNKVSFSLLGGLDLTTGKPIFGGSLSKPVLGPLTLGIFGLSNGSAGFSLGLNF